MKRLEIIENRVTEIIQTLKPDKVLVVTDVVVDGLIGDMLKEYPRAVIGCGEEHKTLRQAEEIWNVLEETGATRRSLVVNIGGGMVSDLGGFAAATFKRGIRYLNVATTLLAAVDAAIGGKTGLNYAGLKNEIGAFALPEISIPAISLFSSLPQREWLSGYGEMLKTGLLSGDRLFDELAEEGLGFKSNEEKLDRLVKSCAAYKEKIVARDMREGGLRKILNLGHTAGHAIEMLLLEKGRPEAHGIAVAYGLLVCLILSRISLGLKDDLMYRYARVLKENFPPIGIVCDDVERLLWYMDRDKKNGKTGTPAFVLLKKPGEPLIDREVSKTDIAAAIEVAIDMGI